MALLVFNDDDADDATEYECHRSATLILFHANDDQYTKDVTTL